MSIEKGTLYVVATPIGNLGDITYRALDVLAGVDLIAAEDTRRTRILLQHYGIAKQMIAVHEHNERELSPRLLARLETGIALALVSDAGTPLISDPGFALVRSARERGIPVVPVPGAAALICALSAAGLPSDHFVFEGFAPRQPSQRRRWLEGLAEEWRTLVFYESSHRIIATLGDLASALGPQREAVLARELTKLHETFLHGTPGELKRILEAEPLQQRGEFVVLVRGAQPTGTGAVPADKVLQVLSGKLPLKQAVELTCAITGEKKNLLYQQALAAKQQP